jgi:dihydropteroate synthase
MHMNPYHIMGILNITPDSFSDGGKFVNINKAIEHTLQMIKEGANSIDIGGESTRPQAVAISPQEEMDRILPVVEILKKENIAVSVDTRNSQTMREALKYNVDMINDISALTHDPLSVDVLRDSQVKICLMHMRGTPQTMQDTPHYDDVVTEVKNFLADRIQTCLQNNIAKERLWIDVGIGFGKTLNHNITLLKNIDRFLSLGCPILLGTSRKSFIAGIAGHAEPIDRLGGSIASVLQAYTKGIRAFRVHDVMATKQALDVWREVTG